MRRTTHTSSRRAALALAVGLGALGGVRAQAAGDITRVGDTQVSAMMYLGNDDKVYILDKSENNAAQIDGHPAYGAVWDIATNKAQLFRVMSNPFCAAGFHLPDGQWATFGGNAATTRNESQVTGIQDWQGDGPSPDYGVTDGRQAIRIVKPCTGDADSWGTECQEQNPGQMLRRRWYATAEALGDGSIMIVGGMVYGGYINRSDKWFTDPAPDPIRQRGNAENTIEFYPPRPAAGDKGVVASPLLVKAVGLNTYAHTFLMPSGKVFINANISSVLFDTTTYTETQLPDDPNAVVRVYPASAGVAMLPLTPENNYTPTILFCGGTNALSDRDWGTYHSPGANVWEKKASDDCQRLEPEPVKGGTPAYEADDKMPDPRTMGQFITLPDGTLLMINGARMGTAGYTTDTPLITSLAQMPFYMSLATDPVFTPAIYDPSKPKGSRWSSAGMKPSTIPRLYHSGALLLPDGRVMVAGSNPGADVVLKADNVPYPTTYDAEYFYPPYWAKTRPVPAGLPKTLTYGGKYFEVTLAKGQYKNANDAAAKSKVVLVRSGFTTHGMNMGQRLIQLNSTSQVADDGTITLSVSQLPRNANLFTPGPALIFVVVDGVPSIGTHVLVGSGKIETQTLVADVALPANVQSSKFSAAGSSSGSTDGTTDGTTEEESSVSIPMIAGIAAGALVVIGLVAFIIYRRRRSSDASPESGLAAGGAVKHNPYAAAPDTPTAGPYGNNGAMVQTNSNFNVPATQHYDYDRVGAAAITSQTSLVSGGNPNGYNSQPQRDYQPQGGYGGQGHDYQQGGYGGQEQQYGQYNQQQQHRGY